MVTIGNRPVEAVYRGSRPVEDILRGGTGIPFSLGAGEAVRCAGEAPGDAGGGRPPSGGAVEKGTGEALSAGPCEERQQHTEQEAEP